MKPFTVIISIFAFLAAAVAGDDGYANPGQCAVIQVNEAIQP